MKPVILIDDDAASRQVLQRFVHKLNYAAVALDGSHELKRHHKDILEAPVVFIDYHLDGELGSDVAKSILKLNPTAAIVLISSDTGIDLETLHDELGTFFFVPKPIPFQMFSVVVNNAVEFSIQRKKDVALRRFRRLLLDWFNQNIAHAISGEHPGYENYFEGVCQHLKKVLDFEGCFVLASKAQHSDWYVLFDSDHERMIEGDIVRGEADQVWLNQALKTPGLRVFKAGNSPVASPPLDDLNQDHLILGTNAMKISGHGMVWILRRSRENHPFLQWEIEMVKDVQYLVMTLLNTVYMFDHIMDGDAIPAEMLNSNEV